MTGPNRVARIITNNGLAVMTQTPHKRRSMPLPAQLGRHLHWEALTPNTDYSEYN
jgi:hypothetical protein